MCPWRRGSRSAIANRRGRADDPELPSRGRIALRGDRAAPRQGGRAPGGWRPVPGGIDRSVRGGDPAGARGVEPMAGRKKIIIVDDDRETREMLKMALELEGYEVTQAANGLRLISTLHVDRPDLILLDVMMSWIDGFELCRAVKKNEEFRDIPVIFISAKKTAGDIRTGLAAGAADYFSKPIDMERLLARIQALIGPAGAGAARER